MTGKPTEVEYLFIPKDSVGTAGDVSVPEGVSKGVPKTNDRSHLLNLKNTGVSVCSSHLLLFS